MSDIDAFKRPAPLEAGLMCQVLHGDHAELQDEEQCDDGYHDVLAAVLSREDGDYSVGNSSDSDAVGDGICEKHGNYRHESDCCGCEVCHVDLLDVAQHENSYVNQSGSSSAGGNN